MELCHVDNCFTSVTGIRTLGFGRSWYGQLFLAIAGLLVKFRMPVKCYKKYELMLTRRAKAYSSSGSV